MLKMPDKGLKWSLQYFRMTGKQRFRCSDAVKNGGSVRAITVGGPTSCPQKLDALVDM